MQRYEANLPSVGLVSFMKSPICEDFSKIDADVAILGVPYDAGIGFRPGTRFGPRDIRNYSVRYSGWGSWKSAGYWDVNTKKRMLAQTRIVDCGDVDIAYYDIERNMRLITQSVGAILDRNALPVLLGGDHSVSYPIVSAFERFGPLDIVHFDAHLDWIDHVGGRRSIGRGWVIATYVGLIVFLLWTLVPFVCMFLASITTRRSWAVHLPARPPTPARSEPLLRHGGGCSSRRPLQPVVAE